MKPVPTRRLKSIFVKSSELYAQVRERVDTLVGPEQKVSYDVLSKFLKEQESNKDNHAAILGLLYVRCFLSSSISGDVKTIYRMVGERLLRLEKTKEDDVNFLKYLLIMTDKDDIEHAMCGLTACVINVELTNLKTSNVYMAILKVSGLDLVFMEKVDAIQV